jgi:enamine deaminase RidA (YjgF/YER057c/UK114 family)
VDLSRVNYTSGSKLEAITGFSRMVKVGSFVYLAGTTSLQPDGEVYGIGNPYEQTRYILEKFIALLEEAGSKKEEVIRVKVYTTDMAYAPEIAKAFSGLLFDVKPLLTMVGIQMLNRPTQLVEIEMDAVIGSKV